MLGKGVWGLSYGAIVVGFVHAQFTEAVEIEVAMKGGSQSCQLVFHQLVPDGAIDKPHLSRLLVTCFLLCPTSYPPSQSNPTSPPAHTK